MTVLCSSFILHNLTFTSQTTARTRSNPLHVRASAKRFLQGAWTRNFGQCLSATWPPVASIACLQILCLQSATTTRRLSVGFAFIEKVVIRFTFIGEVHGNSFHIYWKVAIHFTFIGMMAIHFTFIGMMAIHFTFINKV